MSVNSLRHRRNLLLMVLLAPALAWLLVIYIGSLTNLLHYSLYSYDEVQEKILTEVGLISLAKIFTQPNLEVILRTLGMALAVTVCSVVIAFPLASYMARHARGWLRFLVFFAVMMPLWSSYLVKLYVWKMLLAKDGVVNYLATHLGLGTRSKTC